jgi:hypothetical protein
MNHIQTALIVIGALALAEATWGLASPYGVKRFAGWFVKVARPTQPAVGVFFLGATVLLWVVVLLGQPLSSWLVLICGLVFALVGLLCFKAGSMQKLLSIWILNRTAVMVRIIYGVELVVAITFIVVALAHK